MRTWLSNVLLAIKTVGQGMYVTLWYFFQTYKRKTFTSIFQYPEKPVPVKPRYRGFHHFDPTTRLGCDKYATAPPIHRLYLDKEKAAPPLTGFTVNGSTPRSTKCMHCARGTD